jgi:hypothetical protein
MTTRVTLLLGTSETVRDDIEPALGELLPKLRLQTIRSGRGGTMLRLLAGRPLVVIAEVSAPNAVAAAIYRATHPRSRLLLCGPGPARTLSRRERFVLGRADGMLPEGADIGRAIERLRVPRTRPEPLPVPDDLNLFLACRAVRDPAATNRLLHVGPLSPDSGAVEALIALAAWAERHPSESAAIWWAGEGDLAGVLAAQPLPDNLSQRFLGPLSRRELALALGDCGLLVAVSAESSPPLVEALGAGCLIVANRRLPLARRMLQAGAPLWLFDPMRPTGLADMLQTALGTAADGLDQQRDQAQRLVGGTATATPDQTGREAVTALLAGAKLAGRAALT